jgi:hypothetical protein
LLLLEQGTNQGEGSVEDGEQGKRRMALKGSDLVAQRSDAVGWYPVGASGTISWVVEHPLRSYEVRCLLIGLIKKGRYPH